MPPFPRPTVSLEMPPKFVSCNAPALTPTSPALPAPRASLDMVAPLMTDRLAAATLTVPVLPLLPFSASVVIPVRKLGSALTPSIVSAPATLTERLPALPDPNVPLEI